MNYDEHAEGNDQSTQSMHTCSQSSLPLFEWKDFTRFRVDKDNEPVLERLFEFDTNSRPQRPGFSVH